MYMYMYNCKAYYMYNYNVHCMCSYERSDTPLEVMRMLMDDPNETEEYVLSSNNK